MRAHTQPSATILILPYWKHTPYLARNLHTNYIQKIITLPHTHTTHGTHLRKYSLNIYIVANSKALNLLEPHHIQNTMNMALTQAYGYTMHTALIDTTILDATNIDSITSYKDTLTPIQTHKTTTILYTKPHNIKWNLKDFVYKVGSEVKATTHWELGSSARDHRPSHI